MFKNIYSGLRLATFAAVALLISVTSGFAMEAIGKIKNLEGEAVVVRADQKIPAVLGMDIQQGDRIETKAKSAVGILFTDDTRLSLSANSALTIDNYVFDKQTEKGGFVSNLLRGTLAFLTGKIGKQSPENVKVKTPLATIGIRGTKFIVTVES